MLAVLLLAVTASCRNKVLHECPRWRAELEAYAERLEGRKCLNPKQCIESAVRALESVLSSEVASVGTVLSSEVASARQQNMTLAAT